MTGLLLYLLRAGLYLGVFYAFYLLVMRRTTFFRFNRCIVLLGSVLCALLPLLRLRSAPLLVAAGPLTIAGVGEAEAGAAAASFSWSGLLSALYIAGMCAVALYTLVSAWLLHRRVAGGTKTHIHGFKTVILANSLPSFTCGRTIFIGQKDLQENPAIFSHEAMHVKCRHYLDLFFFRAVQIVWWWNPLVWIMRTELGLLHEYEADEGVINQGIDATQYQLLLVRKAVGEQRFSLASGFQHAQLKNRIEMMLKPSTNKWMRLYYVGLIPVLVIIVYACNPAKNNKVPDPAAGETESPAVEIRNAEPDMEIQDPDVQICEIPDSKEEVPFQLVETKPTFQGGDAGDFSRWVNSQLSYPEQAKADKITGRVVLQFTVGTDGAVRDVKVLKSAHELLDAEALKVISASPKWEPGRQKGEPVAVTYIFPVVFQLR